MVDKARINNTLGKMGYYLNNHENICVSVSGGSDSDIIVHMIATRFKEYLPKIHFVFSNTGLEYKATLNHLDYMEEHYGIKIDRVRGLPIPISVKKYGIPFISKQASEFINRLQNHEFRWEDKPLLELDRKYPKLHAALRYWCNDWGEKSRFNIKWNKSLKDFLIKEKPELKISNACCQKSKKDPLMNFEKMISCDLSITGERKSEGGARSNKQNCFENSHGIDHYMPLFFWNDDTKKWYESKENIIHSDCYKVYGLKRTGCVGCPYSMNRKEELEIMKKHEPKLYKACINVFGKSYELTDKYDEFKEHEKNDRA